MLDVNAEKFILFLDYISGMLEAFLVISVVIMFGESQISGGNKMNNNTVFILGIVVGISLTILCIILFSVVNEALDDKIDSRIKDTDNSHFASQDEMCDLILDDDGHGNLLISAKPGRCA